jgi:hypothetical protein
MNRRMKSIAIDIAMSHGRTATMMKQKSVGTSIAIVRLGSLVTTMMMKSVCTSIAMMTMKRRMKSIAIDIAIATMMTTSEACV